MAEDSFNINRRNFWRTLAWPVGALVLGYALPAWAKKKKQQEEKPSDPAQNDSAESKYEYAHNGAEDNADAHLKRTIMGREVVCAVTQGRLDLGPWEQIFYGEFDGLRKKRVLVKIIGE